MQCMSIGGFCSRRGALKSNTQRCYWTMRTVPSKGVGVPHVNLYVSAIQKDSFTANLCRIRLKNA